MNGISILINNYNYGRFLAAAIESVLNQSSPPEQIIVVDDGSTDNSVEIARSYEQRGVILIEKENGGQNSAIRLGLKHVNQEYTIILDSDDTLRPDACAKIKATVTKDNQPTAVMYRLRVINLKGEQLNSLPVLPFIRSNTKAYIRKHGYINHAPTSGNAYKTSFLQSTFSYVKVGSFCDGFLAWAAGWQGDIAYVDEDLGEYLVHGANTSTMGGRDPVRRYKNNNYTIDHCKNLEQWIKNKDNGIGPDWINLINAYIWREIAYFKIWYGMYSDITWTQCIRFGVAKFSAASHHGAWRQIKNSLFLVAAPVISALVGFAGMRKKLNA
jgi:glycosyltransferase involved in cell wall biosynthesis